MIGTVKDWTERGALSDYYEEPERERIEAVLEKHGLEFDEIMESHFENYYSTNPAAVKKALLKEPDFIWEAAFQSAMEY